MPLSSRRERIDELNPEPDTANAGLWLDRYLPEQIESGQSPSGEHPNTTLNREAHRIDEPTVYEEYLFKRWREMFAPGKLPQYQHVEAREARVRGRMAVGLGADGVLETAITLHRTYGVPYIPGSALKGLAAAYAHRFLTDDRWRKEVRDDKNNVVTKLGEAHKVMFGDTTASGYVTFFDALYIPKSGQKDLRNMSHALWPDVITVHHPDYYQAPDGRQLAPPADWDSPTPVSFVSATGKYLVALAGPPAWVATAFDILTAALDTMGVGGKTASGYGRITLLTADDGPLVVSPGLVPATSTPPLSGAEPNATPFEEIEVWLGGVGQSEATVSPPRWTTQAARTL